MRLMWTSHAWEDYCYWKQEDPGMLSRVSVLLRSALEDPDTGEGDPVPHKYGATRAWSRHIAGDHRLVYMVERCKQSGIPELIVLQARYHR